MGLSLEEWKGIGLQSAGKVLKANVRPVVKMDERARVTESKLSRAAVLDS